jgi:hypothetical protein
MAKECESLGHATDARGKCPFKGPGIYRSELTALNEQEKDQMQWQATLRSLLSGYSGLHL